MYTVTFDHFNVGHGGYHALTLAAVEEDIAQSGLCACSIINQTNRPHQNTKQTTKGAFHSSWEWELKRHPFSF